MITKQQLLKHKPLMIGGPCSVSSRKQILHIAQDIKDSGAHALRAQLWKPRTKPNSFRGVGEKGISWIKEVKAQGLLLARTGQKIHF